MIPAIEIKTDLSVAIDGIQLHFSAAVGTKQEARQRMRIASPGLSALRYRFLYFPNLIPLLLCYDCLVRIFYYNPLAFVFLNRLWFLYETELHRCCTICPK